MFYFVRFNYLTIWGCKSSNFLGVGSGVERVFLRGEKIFRLYIFECQVYLMFFDFCKQ